MSSNIENIESDERKILMNESTGLRLLCRNQEEKALISTTATNESSSISSSLRYSILVLCVVIVTTSFVWLTQFSSATITAAAVLKTNVVLENPQEEIISIKETTTPSPSPSQYHEFPKDFVWGAATSSYQIEGATHEGGRGVSIWDTYCQVEGNIIDGSNGDIACDHYHRMEEDVRLMKDLGLKAYRFSISWPRILPKGKTKTQTKNGDEQKAKYSSNDDNDNDNGINHQGIAFYNRLIDELLKNDIEPWVTLYHWDLPQALEDEYGGWLSPNIVDDFGTYASVCFEAFGDRVNHWITINESWSVAVQGYEDGTKAPGIIVDPQVNVYLVAHHLLLAHARAVRIFRETTTDSNTSQEDDNGRSNSKIGIANCGPYSFPLHAESLSDIDAAERSMVFQYAWLIDPLVFGDYPSEMRIRVGERLPQFTDAQRQEIVDSSVGDFIGLNHYSSVYAASKTEHPRRTSSSSGYWADIDVDFSSNPSWRKNSMGWSTNPDGCRELLRWIFKRYGDIPIVITENGTAENDHNLEAATHDEGRRQYFEDYIRACGEAIDLYGVPLKGYFAWSLMDNFEWEYGYTKRFGICYVDYQTLERTPKSSALWYKQTIQAHGSNILKRA